MRLSLTGAMIPRAVKRMFDQRGEPRQDASGLSAVMSAGERSQVVRLVNLSSSGTMVISSQIPRIGERVSLQLLDREAVEGHVRWVRDGLIGIHFVTSLDSGEE
jgi:hypothetical protein